MEVGNKIGGINADPKFVDVWGDWHIQSGSPAIDSGVEIPDEIVSCFDGRTIKVDKVDFDGNPREGKWDIGIYSVE